jgi:hypothetical protein
VSGALRQPRRRSVLDRVSRRDLVVGVDAALCGLLRLELRFLFLHRQIPLIEDIAGVDLPRRASAAKNENDGRSNSRRILGQPIHFATCIAGRELIGE